MSDAAVSGTCAHPQRDYLTLTDRFWITMALDFGVAHVSAAYADYGTLEPIQRQRGRSYPSCCAREYPQSRRWERHDEYDWCPEKARWRFNEQEVCPEHAAQMALGIMVKGIPLDGRWRNGGAS